MTIDERLFEIEAKLNCLTGLSLIQEIVRLELLEVKFKSALSEIEHKIANINKMHADICEMLEDNEQDDSANKIIDCLISKLMSIR